MSINTKACVSEFEVGPKYFLHLMYSLKRKHLKYVKNF